MAQTISPRFARLKRAGQLIASVLESPNASMIRKAEECGCLEEFEFLCEETRLWLDDDDYYDDVAWNLDNHS